MQSDDKDATARRAKVLPSSPPAVTFHKEVV
jgi:hypothetical protein